MKDHQISIGDGDSSKTPFYMIDTSTYIRYCEMAKQLHRRGNFTAMTVDDLAEKLYNINDVGV